MHGEVRSLCNIIVYTLEKIDIFEDLILNEDERREKK